MTSEQTMSQLLNETRAIHAEQFGNDPVWGAVAPGRVNLIGDHTDYSGGFAMPFAVGLYTAVMASPRGKGHTVYSSVKREQVSFEIGKPDDGAHTGAWHDYIRGVLSLAEERGFAHPGLSISVHSNLPIGSGLSSSASLEVAVATLIEAVCDRRLDPLDKIRVCQEAEHRYAGMPCGVLDQYSVCMAERAHLMLLDCRDCSAKAVPMSSKEVSFVVSDSQVRHSLTDGGYAARHRECQEAERALGKSLRDVAEIAEIDLDDETLYRRAKHVVSENKRVIEMVAALTERRYAYAGELMNESHESLRSDYSVSCEEVDTLAEIARSTPGVVGARMTGGGFGGSVIALVENPFVADAQQRIHSEYLDASGLNTVPAAFFPVGGATAIEMDSNGSRPVDGA